MFNNFIILNKNINLEETFFFDLFVKNEFEIFSKYIIVCLILSSLFALIPYFLNGRWFKENEKISEYECGFEPFDSATRQPFTIHFYIVGILFLIFDVEIALLFPWSVLFFLIDWYSIFIMFFFLFILTIAYIYEWTIGAINWVEEKSMVKSVLSTQGKTPIVHLIETPSNTKTYLKNDLSIVVIGIGILSTLIFKGQYVDIPLEKILPSSFDYEGTIIFGHKINYFHSNNIDYFYANKTNYFPKQTFIDYRIKDKAFKFNDFNKSYKMWEFFTFNNFIYVTDNDFFPKLYYNLETTGEVIIPRKISNDSEILFSEKTFDRIIARCESKYKNTDSKLYYSFKKTKFIGDEKIGIGDNFFQYFSIVKLNKALYD